MKLTPLADHIVVKFIEGPETTKSGILLTAVAQEKSQVAEVVAVGPGGFVNGLDVVMTTQVGDRVVISKYAGTDVTLDDESFTIVHQSDVLAVV